jgi:(E)-4-hydroxy-3-methylbut-2-enyl-diphosphate synthase
VLLTINDINDKLLSRLNNDHSVILILESDNDHGMPELRRIFCDFILNNIMNPVIIKRSYKNISLDELRLFSSTDFGSLLIDGFGDGVWMECSLLKKEEPGNLYTKSFIRKKESSEGIINRILFGILQAARTRISKTEYIACPSCGRTLFDLQETTEKIRKRTEHLKGVKIAIMGCIVNGPGEMADADYGYVGSGPGRITLYKGKDVVKRNIPAHNAVDSLIEIIKENDNWLEPDLQKND